MRFPRTSGKAGIWKRHFSMMSGIYDFEVIRNDGTVYNLEALRNNVVLIINVASFCGYTNQYTGLQVLYDKYHGQGFEILAFPCNQFGSQEPGTNDEIKEFCAVNYAIQFPLMDKIEVNGDSAHPLYKLLTKGQPIKWNFEKFLIDRRGNIDRYSHKTKPAEIEDDIIQRLRDDEL